MEAFRPIGKSAWPRLPVTQCPRYWECGDYALMVRASPKHPGKVQMLCPYHAQQVEREEAATRDGSVPHA